MSDERGVLVSSPFQPTTSMRRLAGVRLANGMALVRLSLIALALGGYAELSPNAYGQIKIIQRSPVEMAVDGELVDRIRDQLLPSQKTLSNSSTAFLSLRVLETFQPDLQLTLRCERGTGRCYRSSRSCRLIFLK